MKTMIIHLLPLPAIMKVMAEATVAEVAVVAALTGVTSMEAEL